MLPETRSPRRDLWVLRAYYFLWVGGGGFLLPFLNLFLNRRGLDGTQIGLVTAIISVVGLVMAPVWARMSSRSSQPIRLLQLSLVLTGIATVFLSDQYVFSGLAFFLIIRILVGAGLIPISDSIALRIAEAHQVGYGSVRVWGSFGWAVIVLSAGWLIEQTRLESGFYGFATAMIFSALLLFGIKQGDSTRLPVQARQAGGLRVSVWQTLRSPVLLGLGGMLFLVGLANLGVIQFENIYLSQLGAGEGLIGVASMVQSVVEIPGMLLADRMTRRFKPASMVLISLVITGTLRALVFTFPAVATIMIARAINGIAFSFYTVSLIRYISQASPAGQTGTALAIFTVTLPSIINILGSPLAGRLFDLVGAHWLYLISLAGYLLGGTVLRAAQSVHQIDRSGNQSL